ncbi:MAG: putative outer membrane protein [Pseudomonas sp.]|nr:putative outer membrane protein [Pseudomonas sp.]
MNNLKDETGHHADDPTKIAKINGGVLGKDPVTNKAPTVDNSNVRQSFSASINPLVAAAATLLSKLVEIKYTKITDFNKLRDELDEEIDEFRSHASELAAESSLTEASYVLCTVLDEAAVLAQGEVAESDKASAWSTKSLLYKRHEQRLGGEEFFKLLTRLRANPLKHLDMLELMYLCLALEFKGQFHSADKKGEAELAEIRDGLYRTIRHLRGDVPRELSPHWQGLQDQRRGLVRIVPWWLVVLFTLMCLAVMYSGFAWVLSEQRETVLEPYRQLDAAVIEQPSQDRDAR